MRSSLGLVYSPAGPGPIIQVQVHPYLDLDPDIWGPPGPELDFGQSSQRRSSFTYSRLSPKLYSGWQLGSQLENPYFVFILSVAPFDTFISTPINASQGLHYNALTSTSLTALSATSLINHLDVTSSQFIETLVVA